MSDWNSNIKYVLALDCETTGLNQQYTTDNVGHRVRHPAPFGEITKGHQAIAWGLVVADVTTLKPVEELYVEVKWDPKYSWSAEAEAIHGLSREHLEQHGLSPEDAVTQIANMIIKYWGTPPYTRGIVCLGQNVATFDVPFLERLFSDVGLEFSLGTRHIDTFGLGVVTAQVTNSNELFEYCGMPSRGSHNALDDAKRALAAARAVRAIYQLGEAQL